MVAVLAEKGRRLSTDGHSLVVHVDRQVWPQFPVLLPQVNVWQVPSAKNMASLKLILLPQVDYLGLPDSLLEFVFVQDGCVVVTPPVLE